MQIKIKQYNFIIKEIIKKENSKIALIIKIFLSKKMKFTGKSISVYKHK